MVVAFWKYCWKEVRQIHDSVSPEERAIVFAQGKVETPQATAGTVRKLKKAMKHIKGIDSSLIHLLLRNKLHLLLVSLYALLRRQQILAARRRKTSRCYVENRICFSLKQWQLKK